MHNEGKPLISNEILNRKGARKISDIPLEVIALLLRGQLQTVNLTEWLAVDHTVLLQNVMDELGVVRESEAIIQRVTHMSEKKVMKIIPAIAHEWLVHLEDMTEPDRLQHYAFLAKHHSDSVRCWAAYMIGLNVQLSLNEKLVGIRPFAADSHFGVREIAWMAMREATINQLNESVHYLVDWARDEDANIRRFAIELTRPHGVWAKHITALKEDPSIALPLLELVKSDSSKYVQDSVSNWLNDASKTNPSWVMDICNQWAKGSDTKETKRIVIRAMRSIVNKK
ncbi:DNA alkylation repair protein [Paenibacillus sp. L3-i20]|nr:DNA alkylation repair protein [Paenibacillus sp. L3-i20]